MKSQHINKKLFHNKSENKIQQSDNEKEEKQKGNSEILSSIKKKKA